MTQTWRTVRGPAVMAMLYLVPVVLWAYAAPLGARFADLTTSLRSVAVVFGLTGTCAFAVNLVLGARIRVVEALMGDLERMYRIHRINGRTAFSLLLAHALVMVASRATTSSEAVVALFDPRYGWTVPLGVIALALMTIGIFLTLYVRLGHEVFVYVQRAFGFVFLLAALHVFRTPGTKALSAPLTYYLAAISALGIGAFAYRSLLGNLLVRRHTYRVSAVNLLDEDVTEIVMVPEGRPLSFVPGQFAFVNFRSIALSEQFHPLSVVSEGESATFYVRAGEISNQFHPFSITSAPGEATLRFTVKSVGDYTRALRRLERGATAIVEGPYGSFSYVHVANPKQVWIAGGIGITPFLSMSRSLGDEPLTIDLFYAVERADELRFFDELRAIAERHGDMRVHPVLREEVGFLTAAAIERTTGSLLERDFLICGPPAMLENLRSQLLEAGVPAAQIHAEEFGFARLGRRKKAPASSG